MSIEEYRHLYQEIGRNAQVSQNVFVANFTVTAALIGYGLSEPTGPIFLAPFAILVPSLFFLASQLESTTRIAAYLLVFFESDSKEFRWETRWLKLRKRGLLPAQRMYTLSLSGLYGLLSIVCLLLALRWWEFSICLYLAAAIPIVLTVGAGVVALRATFSITRVDAHIAAWQTLRDEGQNPNSGK